MKIIAIGAIPLEDNPTEFMLEEDEDTSLLWNWLEQGILLETYQLVEAVGTVLIFNQTHTEDVQSLLNQLPVVQQGLVTFTLLPLTAIPSVEQQYIEKDLALPAWWPPIDE